MPRSLSESAEGEGRAEELYAVRGVRVQAGELGGSGEAVVDGVGVDIERLGRAASVEVAVEEGGD